MDLRDRALSGRVQAADIAESRKIREYEIQVARRLADATLVLRTQISARGPLFAFRMLLRAPGSLAPITPAFFLGCRPPRQLGAKNVVDRIVEKDDFELM